MIGRRGGCLLILSFLWVFIGISVWNMPIPIGRPRAPHEFLPLEVRTLGWVIGSSVGFGSALLPQGRDRWGFFALMIMPAERMCSWALVLVIRLHEWNEWLLVILNPGLWAVTEYFHDKFVPLPLLPSAMAGAATWGAVVGLLFIISGWLEYPKVATTNGAT